MFTEGKKLKMMTLEGAQELSELFALLNFIVCTIFSHVIN